MGYRKAVKILPPRCVVALIQQYGWRIYLYSERKEQEKLGRIHRITGREMEERNRKIYALQKQHEYAEMLSGKYFLSDKSIQGLLRMKKENKAQEEDSQPFAGGNPFSHSFSKNR